MLVNYIDDPTLFARCIQLIDDVFPGIKKVAMQGMKYGACWDKVSLPFIIENNGEVIAHLGIIPLEILLHQKQCHVAAIHGICVKENFRGQGLFKQLMQEAIHYIQQHFDAALLFTDQPDLYTRYHFSILPEYDFIIDYPKYQTPTTDLRTLSLDNKDDLNLIQDLLHDHLPTSNQMSLVNESTIFILDNLHKKIFFSAHINALIVYEIKDNCLVLKEVLSKKLFTLDDIAKCIPERFNKIVLQFCPDKFTSGNFFNAATAVLAAPECSIMVSEDFPFIGNYFRYPEPYRC